MTGKNELGMQNRSTSPSQRAGAIRRASAIATSRRDVVLVLSALPLALATNSRADELDPRLGVREEGRSDARYMVHEWISLGCSHCAHFFLQTAPTVRTRLINTGDVALVYHDFPLDRVSLTACMVARAFDPKQYVDFLMVMFSQQASWAGPDVVDPVMEIKKQAMKFGMSEDIFEATINDQPLRNAIRAQQAFDHMKPGVDATPSFLFGKSLVLGELGYDSFVGHMNHAIR